jgi:hypothetical protein
MEEERMLSERRSDRGDLVSRVARALLVAGVVGALVIGGLQSAQGDSGYDLDFPGLVKSDFLAGPTVLSARLISDGRAARAGSYAVLYAWPSQETIERIDLGETVKLVPVGYDIVDQAGRVDLKISDADALARYANEHGVVNLEMIATDDESVYSYSIGIDGAVTADGSKRLLPHVLEAAQEEVTVNPVPGAIAAENVSFEKSGCISTFVQDYGLKTVDIAWAYAVPGAATVDFTYSQGASTTIGVAVSATGTYGSFSASGSGTTTAGASQGFPATDGYKILSTKFRFGKWKLECSGYPHGDFLQYRSGVKNFEGGSLIRSVSSPPSTPAAYCIPQAKGADWMKDETTAYESSGGAQVSSAIGINLSSRTGYSTKASLLYVWKKAGKLCGTNATPVNGAKRLVAK